MENILESQQKEKRAKVLFTIYGILNITGAILGIFIGYMSIESVQRYLYDGFSSFISSVALFYYFSITSCLIIGFALLKKKRWTPDLLLVATSVSAYNKLSFLMSLTSMIMIDLNSITKSVLISFVPLFFGIFFTWYSFKYKYLFSN